MGSRDVLSVSEGLENVCECGASQTDARIVLKQQLF